MTIVEKNYSTMKKETLAMIYATKKFYHYMLGNSFMLFVNHQALVYFVNKRTIIR